MILSILSKGFASYPQIIVTCHMLEQLNYKAKGDVSLDPHAVKWYFIPTPCVLTSEIITESTHQAMKLLYKLTKLLLQVLVLH